MGFLDDDEMLQLLPFRLSHPVMVDQTVGSRQGVQLWQALHGPRLLRPEVGEGVGTVDVR